MLKRFFRSRAQQTPKILLIAYYDPAGIVTVVEHVEKIKEFSQYQIEIYNMFGKRYTKGFKLPKKINFRAYNAVIIHNTVSYNPDNLFNLDSISPVKFSEYSGVKVLLKQDEHYRTNDIIHCIQEKKIHIVVSVLAADKVHLLYPRDKVPGVRFLQGHTGYVSNELRKIEPLSLTQRARDIGYRGSQQPFNFGWLSYEKAMIGDRFVEICQKEQMTWDISSRWEDRLHGTEWIEFLRTSRGILGAESGSSIIDYDGEVERLCNSYLARHPKASFLEVYEDILKPYENNAYYKAISPRHIEAAACGAVQILFEGEYSGIFKSDVHYIPLRHDFTNISEALEKFRDNKFCENLIDNARRDIIDSAELDYYSFVAELDEAIFAQIKMQTKP